MSKKSKKQTKVTIEPGSVILTPSFIERLQYDACFLETWLLAANVGNEYDDHGCTSYAESLIAEMPEELAPLANVLRQVRANQLTRSERERMWKALKAA